MIRFLQKKGALQKAIWAIIIGITCVSMVAFLGSYFTGDQARANVTGWLKAPFPVRWNIEKK